MIEIECAEMTVDEQLALASAISDAFAGKAVALTKGTRIVLDALSEVRVEKVVEEVRGFVSKWKDREHYSVDSDGPRVTVHTPDPLVRSRGRGRPGLPPHVLQCPFCGFVTPYQEPYEVHVRSHGFS